MYRDMQPLSQNNFKIFSSIPKETPYPLRIPKLLIPHQSLAEATNNTLSVPIDLPIWIFSLNGIIKYVVICVWVLSYTVFFRFIPYNTFQNPVMDTWVVYIFWLLCTHNIYYIIIIYHIHIIIHNAVMNIHAQVWFFVCLQQNYWVIE